MENKSAVDEGETKSRQKKRKQFSICSEYICTEEKQKKKVWTLSTLTLCEKRLTTEARDKKGNEGWWEGKIIRAINARDEKVNIVAETLKHDSRGHKYFPTINFTVEDVFRVSFTRSDTFK